MTSFYTTSCFTVYDGFGATIPLARRWSNSPMVSFFVLHGKVPCSFPTKHSASSLVFLLVFLIITLVVFFLLFLVTEIACATVISRETNKILCEKAIVTLPTCDFAFILRMFFGEARFLSRLFVLYSCIKSSWAHTSQDGSRAGIRNETDRLIQSRDSKTQCDEISTDAKKVNSISDNKGEGRSKTKVEMRMPE